MVTQVTFDINLTYLNLKCFTRMVEKLNSSNCDSANLLNSSEPPKKKLHFTKKHHMHVAWGYVHMVNKETLCSTKETESRDTFI